MRKYDGDDLVEITCNKCGKVEDDVDPTQDELDEMYDRFMEDDE